TACQLFEEKNPVAISDERFNQQKIRLVLFHQLNRRPLISCEPTQCIAQVPADDCSDSLPRDCAVVGDDYTRPLRGAPIADGRPKFSGLPTKVIHRRRNLELAFRVLVWTPLLYPPDDPSPRIE